MTAIPALYQQNSGDVPRYAPLTLADRAVGMHVAIAILAGVVQARSSGQGQEIEISMFEAMAQLVLGDHLGGRPFRSDERRVGKECVSTCRFRVSRCRSTKKKLINNQNTNQH